MVVVVVVAVVQKKLTFFFPPPPLFRRMRLASPQETNSSAFSTFLITLDIVTFSIFVASGVACVYLMKVAGEVKPEEEMNGDRDSGRRRRNPTISVQIAPKRDLLNLTLIRKALDVHRVTAYQKLHEKTSLASMKRVKSQHKIASIRMAARLKKRKKESRLRNAAAQEKTDKAHSAEGTSDNNSEQANDAGPALPTLELNLAQGQADKEHSAGGTGNNHNSEQANGKESDANSVLPTSEKEDQMKIAVEEIRLAVAKYINSRKKLFAVVAKINKTRGDQGMQKDVLTKSVFKKIIKSVFKKMGTRAEKTAIGSAWLSVCLVGGGTDVKGNELSADVLAQWLQIV